MIRALGQPVGFTPAEVGLVSMWRAVKSWRPNNVGKEPLMEERNLSDSDVDKIVERLEQRMLERLQQNVGRGVIAMVYTWSIRAVIILAAYGAGASGFFKKWGL